MWDYQSKHLDTNYSEGTTLLLLCYICCLCRVFDNEHNSCPKVRETALAVERYSMIYIIVLPRCGVINTKTKYGVRYSDKYRYDCAWHLLVRKNMDVIELIDNPILHYTPRQKLTQRNSAFIYFGTF
jgi:hypothetical protein